MTHDDLMRLAYEAGAKDHSNPDQWGILTISHDDIERFASLILSKYVEAMALRGKVEQLKPLRPWVGLTKEEATEISLANRPYVIDMIAALEAKLKEKNT